MNLKTMFVLAVLAIVGGLLWLIVPWHRQAPTSSESLSVLEQQLKPERLQRIEVIHSGRSVVFERGSTGEWTLPGHWPARQAEINRLVGTLTSLQSRFAPIPLDNPPDVDAYGLSKPLLGIRVKTDDNVHELEFGEEPGESNRFSRPTFMRVDNNNEVIRLAPSLISPFIRPFGFYQQHQLFPAEVAKEGTDKTKRLLTKTVMVQEKKSAPTHFTIVKARDDWQLQEQVHYS